MPEALPPAALGPATPPDPLGCPHCGASVPFGSGTCPSCGAFREGQSEVAASAPGLPWENRSTLGMWPAGWATLKDVLLSPGQAFSRLRHPASLGDAFLFFIIFGCGSNVIGAIWGLALQGILMHFWMGLLPTLMPGSGPSLAPGFPAQLQSMFLANGVLGIVLTPFSAFTGLLVYSLLGHLGLLITGSAKKDLPATMAIYAYALGSAAAFKIVPGLGLPASVCWGFVCCISGMIRVHGCKTWQGVVAVLWPFTICCCCAGTGLLAAIGIPALMALK